MAELTCYECGRIIEKIKTAAKVGHNFEAFCSADCVIKFGRKKPAPRPPTKPAGPSETNISKAIEDALDLNGAWSSRTQSGTIRTANGGFMKLCRAGTPDRIAAKGVPFWIEVKRPGKVPSSEQVQVQAILRDNGFLVFTIDDAATIPKILDKLHGLNPKVREIRRLVSELQDEIDEVIKWQKEIKDPAGK